MVVRLYNVSSSSPSQLGTFFLWLAAGIQGELILLIPAMNSPCASPTLPSPPASTTLPTERRDERFDPGRALDTCTSRCGRVVPDDDRHDGAGYAPWQMTWRGAQCYAETGRHICFLQPLLVSIVHTTQACSTSHRMCGRYQMSK